MARSCRRCSVKFDLIDSDAENTKQRKFCSRKCELLFEEEKKARYSKNQNAKKDEKSNQNQLSVQIPDSLFSMLERDRKTKKVSKSELVRKILSDFYS